MVQKFFARGKLLLSAEYAVLQGAKAIALPCVKGQHLEVSENNDKGQILWKSYSHEGDLWFYASFNLKLEIMESNSESKALYLQKILQAAFAKSELKPSPLNLKTQLDFPRDWGLGSSSTLIHLIAQWLKVDAMELFHQTSSGSGYDIACAGVDQPIEYSLIEGKSFWKEVTLPAVFEQVHFVHLNKKQLSDKEVNKFQKRAALAPKVIEQISVLSESMLSLSSIEELKFWIENHEKLLSEILQQKTVKESLFPDFSGSIKSLGAWGGDFVMAVGSDLNSYFSNKAYSTIIPFNAMIA